jgi:hypothetical protein
MAHQIIGTKHSACTTVQAITQRRLLPIFATASGAASWSRAPTRIGTLATMPAATGPRPRASANAEK